MHCLVQETLPVHDARCRPHIGIMYKIAARPKHIMVPKFIRPKRIEQKGELREPIPIDACYDKADSFKSIKPLPEIVPEGNSRMATEYKRLSAAYEMHLASKYASANKDVQKCIGRGDGPRIRWSPVVPKKLPEHALIDEAMCIYHEMENYIRLACSAKPHQRRTRYGAIGHIAMSIFEIEGIPADVRIRLRNCCRRAHRYIPQALDIVAAVIYEAKAQREADLQRMSSARWSKWVTDALNNGAGLVYKWTSQRSKAPPLPCKIQQGDKTLWDPCEKLVHYKGMWNQIWGKRHQEIQTNRAWMAVTKSMALTQEASNPWTLSHLKW